MVVENVNCLFLASLVFSHFSCQHYPIVVVRSLLLHSITALSRTQRIYSEWILMKEEGDTGKNAKRKSRLESAGEKHKKLLWTKCLCLKEGKRERWRWVSSAFSFRMLATLAYECEFTYFFHLPWLCPILWYVFQSSKKKVAFIWAVFCCCNWNLTWIYD